MWAGPWFGELGWELFCWQGFLRKMAARYDRVVVACRTGHALLYRDFADGIIHYDPTGTETDMWKNHDEIESHGLMSYYLGDNPNIKVVKNDSFKSIWWKEHWDHTTRQNFINFATYDSAMDPATNILLIVRDTDKCGTGFRNWPIAHATRFATAMQSRGYSVGCVGRSDSALHIPGTTDYRDVSLKHLAQIMANSRVIVGPQCGPTHFGTLCLLPQVTWQTKPEHAERVKKGWNPFGVPTITMPSDISYWKTRTMWLPPVDEVVANTIEILKPENRK